MFIRPAPGGRLRGCLSPAGWLGRAARAGQPAIAAAHPEWAARLASWNNASITRPRQLGPNKRRCLHRGGKLLKTPVNRANTRECSSWRTHPTLLSLSGSFRVSQLVSAVMNWGLTWACALWRHGYVSGDQKRRQLPAAELTFSGPLQLAVLMPGGGASRRGQKRCSGAAAGSVRLDGGEETPQWQADRSRHPAEPLSKQAR